MSEAKSKGSRLDLGNAESNSVPLGETLEEN